MNDQLDLGLDKSPRKGVTADPADIDLLCEWIAGRGWVRASAIEFYFPVWKSPDHRYVRAMASQSACRILSFPGSPGYRLALTKLHANGEEIRSIHPAIKVIGGSFGIAAGCKIESEALTEIGGYFRAYQGASVTLPKCKKAQKK